VINSRQIAKAVTGQVAPDAVFTCDAGLPRVYIDASRKPLNSAARSGTISHDPGGTISARRSQEGLLSSRPSLFDVDRTEATAAAQAWPRHLAGATMGQMAKWKQPT